VFSENVIWETGTVTAAARATGVNNTAAAAIMTIKVTASILLFITKASV